MAAAKKRVKKKTVSDIHGKALIRATFNNVNVSPKYDNYKLFVDNLKPLYDRGLRCITIPHAHWVAIDQKRV